MENKDISIAVVKRLPRYYRYLDELLENGITRISSKELSQKMNITASQIRQDFNNFGNFGQQGYGYSVEMLRNQLRKILGLNHTYSLILIGVGSLGQALIRYQSFAKRGFKFVGLFDISPELIGTAVNGVEVMDVRHMQDFLRDNPVDIAVFTLPRDSAESALQAVIQAGVKGVWNFSHVDLSAGRDIKVESVHLTDSLMTLSYMLNEGKGV